jgi:hypothetical protein
MTSHSLNARDAGLRLIARINRWLITGAVALTAAIALVTQHAFRAAHPAPATGNSSSGSAAAPTQSSSGGDDGSATANGSALQAPAQAPTPAAPAPSAPVVSGGS